ncbi:MAG: hypothetical protein MN733_00665 [Nitrososphaera sp.]|nr:hypothetical protein [Nitrososphaera sp.]
MKLSEIEAHIPQYVGAVRVVHEGNCYDESLSKSRSLKIERRSDGTITAMCFRCGARYFGRDRSYTPLVPGRAPATQSAAPGGATYDLATWPSAARTWLRKARLTQQHCDRYKIGYVDAVGVTIPEPGGSGYLVRPFNNGNSKYLVRGGMADFIAPPQEARRGPTAVLVEDCLSAIRVADCGATGVALLGTYLKDETKEKVLGYERLVLWLDDDNPTVRGIQARLGATLRQFAPTYVVRGRQEPKNIPGRDILYVLTEV